MRAGAVVALVSDAGMPLVSDPGFILVQACIAAGLSVEVLPGPSSALAALVASGLAAERWRFVGFLPRKKAELERLLVGTPETLVAFESPARLVATLALLAAKDPGRQVAVCRELTKLHEEVRRGSGGRDRRPLRAPSRRAGRSCSSSPPAPGAGAPDMPERALAALRALVEAGARPRPAAKALAELTGRTRQPALPRADRGEGARSG
jgi:16S rRNA (cytidine1402-2'-O)-methyltransferase